MDTQIEQLNLSSITKFALTYAGITTVSELKEYNYISLANVLPLSFLIRVKSKFVCKFIFQLY